MNRLYFAADIGVTDKIVHGGVEIVGNLNQSFNIRLDIVVFVLVYRLLADADGLCQPGLGNAGLSTQLLQILQHHNHLGYIVTTGGG